MEPRRVSDIRAIMAETSCEGIERQHGCISTFRVIGDAVGAKDAIVPGRAIERQASLWESVILEAPLARQLFAKALNSKPVFLPAIRAFQYEAKPVIPLLSQKYPYQERSRISWPSSGGR